MAITADYGSDLAGVGDLDPTMREVTGVRVLQEALATRLGTPRGGLIDDPLYGYDLRDELSEAVDGRKLALVAVNVRAELLKDERVLTARVRVTALGPAHAMKLTVEVDGESAEGPYSLTVSADKLTVELLRGGA